MKPTTCILPFAVALLVLASPACARADFWASAFAVQTSAIPQTSFRFTLGSQPTLTGGGNDSMSNSFANPKMVPVLFNVPPTTLLPFTSSQGGTLLQNQSGYFGVYGTGDLPSMYNAHYLPSGKVVPIVNSARAATDLVVIHNPDPTSNVIISASSYCPKCRPRIDLVPEIPHGNMLVEIPEFHGVLGPGESREVHLPPTELDGVVGFYAAAQFVGPSGELGESAVTWVGVPEPSSGALACLAVVVGGVAAAVRRRLNRLANLRIHRAVASDA